MKSLSVILVTLVFSLILTACGSSPESVESPADLVPTQELVTPGENVELAPGTTANASPAITNDYEGALSTRLLVALGTLKLADTNNPITTEQAPQLLLLWQTLDNLTRSGTSAEAEVSALLAQIESTLTPEQIASINNMKLTQVELKAWAEANGITAGVGTGLDVGAGQGMGQGQNLTAEERATKQAENGMTGTTSNRESGLSSAITAALITYLENIK